MWWLKENWLNLGWVIVVYYGAKVHVFKTKQTKYFPVNVSDFYKLLISFYF